MEREMQKLKRELAQANQFAYNAKQWIKRVGAMTNTCYYYVLGEVCEGCQCKRKLPSENPV